MPSQHYWSALNLYNAAMKFYNKAHGRPTSYGKSIVRFQNAIKLFDLRSLDDTDRRFIIECYINIADAYCCLNDAYDGAINLTNAMKVFEKIQTKTELEMKIGDAKRNHQAFRDHYEKNTSSPGYLHAGLHLRNTVALEKNQADAQLDALLTTGARISDEQTDNLNLIETTVPQSAQPSQIGMYGTNTQFQDKRVSTTDGYSSDYDANSTMEIEDKDWMHNRRY